MSVLPYLEGEAEEFWRRMQELGTGLDQDRSLVLGELVE